MKIERFGKRIIVGVLVAVLALAVVLAGCQKATPAPESRSADATVFTNVEVDGPLAVTGATALTGATAADGGLTIGGGYGLTGCTISTAGALSCDGALTVSGGVTRSGLETLAPATSITVTNGAAFAPLGAIQPIVAAGAVTPTITIPTAGKNICIYNTGTNVITIADTSNQVLTAAAALGQYDWLCFWSDGTRIMETSRADN